MTHKTKNFDAKEFRPFSRMGNHREIRKNPKSHVKLEILWHPWVYSGLALNPAIVLYLNV